MSNIGVKETTIKEEYDKMISDFIIDLKEIMRRAEDRNWYDKEGFIMGVSYAITKMEYAWEQISKKYKDNIECFEIYQRALERI